MLPRIIILTPVKDGCRFLPEYFSNLLNLQYPHEKISIGFLESDSNDGTFDWLRENLFKLEREFRCVTLLKRDFDFKFKVPRWEPSIQVKRRSILAKSRNFLLYTSLDDEEWVLWLDVDVCSYPVDIINQLLAVEKEIVTPECILEATGKSYDWNTFKFKPGAEDQDWTPYTIDGVRLPPKGEGRLHLEDLQNYDLVEVDGVGTTMLLVKADLHREGLNFPSYSYKGYIESEGLAMMAKDMGYTSWGLPNLKILHFDH